MNPNFASYSAASPSANAVFLNSSASSLDPPHLAGVPVQSAISRNQEAKMSGSQSAATTASALVSSKYLKLAQQLLDEVVSVGKGIRDGLLKGLDSTSQMKSDRVDENGKQSVELTTAERQDLQIKKAKLVNMLDEVGLRYRQYRNQMNVVVTSFEAAAGIGSAKTYTALALQTISKRFRCLRDAIAGHIHAAAMSLGEEGMKSKGARAQFVDQQVRQQRALQQLGMIQHNAWRLQRGLPERSVSILRAWLFEHFLHPYPKDSDKQMLAKQTGLTRSQVSNWFINARVRLWKPMVEEMYKEEMEGQEHGDGDDKASENEANEDSSSKSNAYQDGSPARTDQFLMNVHNQASYGEDEYFFLQSKLKKARSEESMNREGENHGYSSNYGGGFGDYSFSGIERFGIEQFAPRVSNNGVSLTLGLTQYGNFSLPGAQASYLSGNGVESSDFSGLGASSSVAHPSNVSLLNCYQTL